MINVTGKAENAVKERDTSAITVLHPDLKCQLKVKANRYGDMRLECTSGKVGTLELCEKCNAETT